MTSTHKHAGACRSRGGMIPSLPPLRNGIAALLLAALAACAPVATPPATAPQAAGDDVASLLAAAEQAVGAERSDRLLDATALLLRQRRFDQAYELLEETAAHSLAPAQRARHTELRARLLLEQGDAAAALALLRDPALLRAESQLPRERQLGLGQVRARALAQQGDTVASIQQRIALEPLLAAAQRERNRALIWQSLMSLDTAQLESQRDRALNRELRGWLELALIAKQNQGNLDLQLQRLDQWLGQWRGHSGQALPDDLRLLRAAAADQPNQVALLLPLTGQLAPFGQALRDGYLAALYAQAATGARTPAVRLYDTHGQPVRELYRRAVADGAEAVVGPLEKGQVAELYQEQLSVPVLALNRAGIDGAPPVNLYQFSLAPEDEAIHLAELARADGLRNALLIAPEAERSGRELAAFTGAWQQLGGRLVAQALFGDEQALAGVINNAFNIPQSQARATALERLLGRNLEFTPRRRQDIDLVVMLANPAQARLIKPTLAYHYAGDIPVYALSRTYTGAPQPELDHDLEGVRFTEMPWLLRDSALKRTITATLAPAPNALRFYAMGIDSFHLQPRLAQLARLPDSRVSGQSGTLRLDARRVVQRELPLAVMRQGRPQEMATALLRLDEERVGTGGGFRESLDATEGADNVITRERGRFD